MGCNRSDISQIVLDNIWLCRLKRERERETGGEGRGREGEREREREAGGKGGRKSAKVANHSYLCLIHSDFICCGRIFT